MRMVSQYWIDKSLEKLEEFGSTVEDLEVSDYIRSLQGYTHVEGEIVELENDEAYQISGVKPLLTSIRKTETYKGERMFEKPDGELTTSYVSDTFTEDEIS